MTEEVQTLTIYHFHHAHHANVLFTTLTLFNMFIMLEKVGAMFAQKSTLTPEMQLVLDQVGTTDEESTQNSTGIIFNSLKSQKKSYSTQKKLKTFFQFEPGRLYLA